nr:hypothetical protein [Armatimonas sp.]
MMLAFISLLSLSFVQAQPPAPQFPTSPLVRHSFATTEEGWLGMGDIAKVSRTSPPQPTLHFEYMVSKMNLNALVRPLEADVFKGAQRLHFELKTDTDTTVAVMLQEKGGGRFTAVAALPKNLWQDIDLGPTDFTLGKDKNDPADANGKLDMDKVESVTLVDLHVFFLQAEGALATALFPGIVAGPRELWLREFSATTASLPVTTLDGLARPQIGWIGVGGLTLQRAMVGSPLTGRALEATYAVSQGKIAGLLRALPLDALTEKTSLNLSVAAKKSMTLLFQLEDDQGGKFDLTVEVPGLRVARKLSLLLSDFKPANESKRDKIDLARVKQVLILDISGLLESVEQNNTLWLANLEAK